MHLTKHPYNIHIEVKFSRRIPSLDTIAFETTSIFAAKIYAVSAAIVSRPGIRRFNKSSIRFFKMIFYLYDSDFEAFVC